MIDIRKALSEIENIDNLKDLEEIRLDYLGKKGKVTDIMKGLKNATDKDRKLIGQYINDIKIQLTEAISKKKKEIEAKLMMEAMRAEAVDVSLPENISKIGTIHPISKVTKEIFDIMRSFSFEFVNGPEIESEFFNFSALNMSEFHPARQMHDTFYLTEKDKVLRTHTSPVQVREMIKRTPPIKIFTCGKVFRNDYDATHTPMFHQMEVLYIGKNITFANMKWFCDAFTKVFFGKEQIKTRLRPSYFPFTEPSAELDIAFQKADDGKYIIGDGDDWLEIVGCGMVHPNVLKSGGIDPSEYQGFAFGFGIERLASLKYGIPDLRGYFDFDTNWRDCFSFSPFEL